MSTAKKYMWPALSVAGGVALAGIGVTAALVATFKKRSRSKLQDNVVIITGGSRGLGLATAEEFARLGAKLVLSARNAEELHAAKQILVQKLSLNEDRVHTVPADLRNADEAQSLIEQTIAHFGRIDVLVNNCGIITVGPAESVTIEAFHDVVNTNLFAGVNCSLAALPHLISRRKGTIVNIASIGGKVAVPHMLPYTASKFAVVGFSQALHAEMRSRGINVITVCPWLMRTGSHLNALFAGDAPREYRWFSLGATLPGLSVSARYAARRIVEAVLRRETEVSISPQAAFAARFAGLLPATTTNIMALSNTLLLPNPDSNSTLYKGHEVTQRELKPATKLGDLAAAQYNQLG